jgi:RimJ/RimL family protein N-acetyltransferase
VIAVEPAATTGGAVLARLEPSDGEALRRLFYRLSPETIYRRFHSPVARPDQTQPQRLLDIDHHDREAVVAVVDGEIVGVARYFRQPGSDAAELAVVVADAWQRQGYATRMLKLLARLARAACIRRFTATVQPDNPPALALLRKLQASGRLSDGQVVATLPIDFEPVSD